MELIFLMFMMMFLLTFHNMSNTNILSVSKMEEIECGLDSLGSSNLNSNQFFLYMIIFLLFDLELVTMIPMVMSISMSFYVLVSVLVLMTMMYELLDYSLKFN